MGRGLDKASNNLNMKTRVVPGLMYFTASDKALMIVGTSEDFLVIFVEDHVETYAISRDTYDTWKMAVEKHCTQSNSTV